MSSARTASRRRRRPSRWARRCCWAAVRVLLLPLYLWHSLPKPSDERAACAAGFYWGFVRQQRLAKREKLAPKRGNKPAPPVIRQVTAVERALRLDRPQSPGMAAFKALLGGTVMSVAGCALLVCGVGALLGVRSVRRVFFLRISAVSVSG